MRGGGRARTRCTAPAAPARVGGRPGWLPYGDTGACRQAGRDGPECCYTRPGVQCREQQRAHAPAEPRCSACRSARHVQSQPVASATSSLGSWPALFRMLQRKQRWTFSVSLGFEPERSGAGTNMRTLTRSQQPPNQQQPCPHLASTPRPTQYAAWLATSQSRRLQLASARQCSTVFPSLSWSAAAAAAAATRRQGKRSASDAAQSTHSRSAAWPCRALPVRRGYPTTEDCFFTGGLPGGSRSHRERRLAAQWSEGGLGSWWTGKAPSPRSRKERHGRGR